MFLRGMLLCTADLGGLTRKQRLMLVWFRVGLKQKWTREVKSHLSIPKVSTGDVYMDLAFHL